MDLLWVLIWCIFNANIIIYKDKTLYWDVKGCVLNKYSQNVVILILLILNSHREY